MKKLFIILIALSLILPFSASALTMTFYPDPHPESTTVDGYARQGYGAGSGVVWATIQPAAGNLAFDSDALIYFAHIAGDTNSPNWRIIGRSIFLFDTSVIGTDSISAATLSLYGNAEADPASWGIDINIYSSAPATDTAVVAGDYDSLGITAYCDTSLTLATFSTIAYNDFAFNAAGIAAISKTGISKFGAREAIHDAGNSEPAHSNSESYFYGYMADQANTTYDPKLVVTYTAASTYDHTYFQSASSTSGF